MKKKFLLSVLLVSNIFAGSYDNGIEFYKKGQYKKALESFKIASNNDDNRAMFAIGIMYSNGDGVRWDNMVAFDWYKKAGIAGNENAFLKLGNLFAAQEDYRKAIKWFLKAANKVLNSSIDVIQINGEFKSIDLEVIKIGSE